MPWSALPPHINEPNEWDGKDDDDHWYTSWRKQVKGWFAFGPRATEWWARWRELPITLFAVFGPGESRWENDFMAIRAENAPVILFDPTSFYLSRVQYWCKWHIQIQWPLFICVHYGGWMGYIGFKRDADKVYWAALYLGRTWK